MINTDRYRIYFVIRKNPKIIGNSSSFPYYCPIIGNFTRISGFTKVQKKKKRNIHPMNFYPTFFQLRVDHMQINYRTASIAWNMNTLSVFCFGSFTLIALPLLMFLFRFAYHYVGRLLRQRSNFTHLTVYMRILWQHKHKTLIFLRIFIFYD